jgi:hypothetical protein
LLVQAIFVASRQRIPDLLGDGALTADELAAPTGAQPAALHRLLRALTGLDVVTGDGDRVALTTLGQSLRSGPHSAAASARFLGSPFVWSAWGALGDAIMDGQAAFRHAHGADMFGYLGTHPDALESFQALMGSQSRLQTTAVLAGCDFSAARTIVDVGGGHGALLAALLQANPGARGILVDRPDVVAPSGPCSPGSSTVAQLFPATSSSPSRPEPTPTCSSSSCTTGTTPAPARFSTTSTTPSRPTGGSSSWRR